MTVLGLAGPTELRRLVVAGVGNGVCGYSTEVVSLELGSIPACAIKP